MKRINPRVDIAFKKLFGVDENKDLLISLINAVVNQEDQVTNITLLNPYNPKSFEKDKVSILDIKAEGESGKRFNIEIQINDEADYDKRALYYWGKLYTEQLQESQDYSMLSKAIGIHILNFTSIPHESKYHNVFQMKEKESNLHYFKDLELHTIELTKFSKDVQESLSELVAKVKNSLDMWVAFLTRHDVMNKERLPKSIDMPELKKALNVLEIMNFEPDERDAYQEHLKWFRMETSALKKRFADGLAEGEAKGLAKGLAKGEAKGEAKEKLRTARKLLKMGLDLEQISQATDLSIEELTKLKKEG